MTLQSSGEGQQRLIAGQAARQFYLDHVDEVFAYATRRVGRDLAGDVTADVFRIALEQSERYDPGRGSHRGWLYGIATNVLRRHWRSEERRLQALARHARREVPPLDPLLRVEDRITARGDAERLMEAVMALAPIDRDLLVLAAWQDASRRDIAEALGVPEGTVRSRLHRIRGELRVHMKSATREDRQP